MADDFKAMLKALTSELKKEQSKKEPAPKSEFQKNLQAIKKDLKEKHPKKRINGGGYEYVPDPETGKMRVRAQVEWEKYHGRKVEEHQCVVFKNGNKRDFSKENLILSYKAGTPLDALTCGNCGCRGNFTVGDMR